MSKGRFSFANLNGGAKAESEDKAEDNDTKAMDEDDDDASDDTTAEGDDGHTNGDEAKGFDAGRAAERERIGKILSASGVNAGNMAQAVAIACNTELTPDQAASILSAGGGSAPKTSLSDRMQSEPDPAVGAGGGDAKKSDGWDAAAQNAGLKLKEKA